TEEFSEFDHIVVALSHLPSIDGDHVVVKPVSDRSCLVANGTLRNFAFMVRELQVHSTSVNVELGAEIFCSHRRAFDVPAGEANTPWTLPSHDVFRSGRFPKSKIGLIAFFFLSLQFSGGFEKFIHNTTTQLSIIVF